MLIHCRIIAYLNTFAKYLFILHQVKTVSAGVLIIRAVIFFRAGGRACKKNFRKKFSKKSHSAENCRTVPQKVAQCRKRVIPQLYTLRRTIAYALPNAYLNTCITYLNTLTRLSALGSLS